MTQPVSSRRQTQQGGVALILVMLAMLLLSALAATLVLTARSETFASYSYKLDTQADYVAKAGIQAGVNWFRSGHYQALNNSQAPNYYDVTSDGSVYNLYTSNTTPVNCIHVASSKCNVTGSPVTLVSYGSGSSNYPKDITNGGGTLVPTAFTNDLKNVQVTGDVNNVGYFCVNAYLLAYQTVNCPTCAQNPAPMETWLITSLGTWGGSSCTSGVISTAEEQVIIQPIYTASWGNAAYGYCDVQMWGSSGTCTDAFNSALGAYGAGNPSVASGACDSSTTNVIDSGAGVGANGYVSLGSNVSISGNVTIGNVGYTPPSSCCTTNCGYSGGGTVQGSVINAAPVTPPAVPTFPGLPVNFPTGPPAAPSFSSSTLPQTSSGNTTPPGGPFDPATNGTYHWPCMTLATCTGTKASPFLLTSLSGGTLIGGPDIGHPVYYDMDSISESGTTVITVNGFAVVNIRSSLSISGNGIVNPFTTSPEALQINVACSGACVTLGGNGGTSGIITAPLATANVGGGGSKGYMVGSVRALAVNVSGGYPIHYDVQLNRLEGTMGQTVVSSYTRIKQ